MLKLYEVTYFDEWLGYERATMVKASSEYDAVEKVELMGQTEVIEVQFVDFYVGADQ